MPFWKAHVSSSFFQAPGRLRMPPTHCVRDDRSRRRITAAHVPVPFAAASLLIAVSLCIPSLALGQDGRGLAMLATAQWAWMSGSSGVNQPGVYGTLRLPSPTSVPGARALSTSWTDRSGKLWLFGGYSYVPGSAGYMNDLWTFDPSTRQWAWMGGAITPNQPGSYGLQGREESTNVPGARVGAVSWTDPNGNLWLFGGSGYATSASATGSLNDLWLYNTVSGRWTWKGGSDALGADGIYGTKGVPGGLNRPGGRAYAVSWKDDGWNLWLFGGNSFNDLWKYDVLSGQWTWISGSSGASKTGTYGSQGIAAPSNTPGSRSKAVSWSDDGGNLWLFGGSGFGAFDTGSGALNDLWKYNLSSGMWTWVTGSSATQASGVYGTPGVPGPNSVPGAREGASAWSGDSGSLWLFGGKGLADSATLTGYLNDIWRFDTATGQWTWMAGARTPNADGVYGVLGTPAAANVPGARTHAASWRSFDGSSGWLFGGYDPWTSSAESLNDLWRFSDAAPEPVCTIACAASGPSSGQTGQNLSFSSSAAPSNCTGAPTYSWSFGDGSSTGVQNPTHSYASAGTYYWTLTTSIGSTQCQQTGSVTISALPTCTIACSASGPGSGQTGQSLLFSSSATPSNCTGTPTFSWTFGDGTSAGVQNPTHAYASAGTFYWTLTTSIGSNQCQQTGTVSVLAAPVCSTFTISPTTTTPSGAAGSISVSVLGAPAGCHGGSWTASANGDWLSVVPSSGIGPGFATVSWLANSASTTRSGSALIAGQPFVVLQDPQGPGPGLPVSYILPSSSFRSGLNGAEYRTDVRIMNQSSSAATVTAYFFDQVTSTTLQSNRFRIDARNQAAFDNVLQSLFGRTLSQGAYGPIRFEADVPLLINASVNNVNACGSGAVSGQWLPGISTSQSLKAGVIGQLAVSSSGSSGYRTNLVFVNPGVTAATAVLKIRRGGGELLSTATVGPLSAYGFRQLAVDAGTFPGVAGATDTNLWLEFTSDQPLVAYATIIHNVSGDPFAVVASADAPPKGPPEITFMLPGNVPLVMARIPAGTFQMGSPATYSGASANELPEHSVTLTSDYYIGKYEVTQSQWQAVMGFCYPYHQTCGGDCPMESVTWSMIRGENGFIAKLNQLLGTTHFRLPTEAEWERAARGGTQTPFSFGNASTGSALCGANADADPYVWWCGNSGATAHPVGTKSPNAYGLHDMHGNILELVEDWYEATYYSVSPSIDPTGPTSGTERLCRGGGLGFYLHQARSATRMRLGGPETSQPYIGFRLALSQ